MEYAQLEVFINNHHIILIHGIAGKKEDFGELQALLMTFLNLESATTKYIVRPWSYDSTNDHNTTEQFAFDLANYLANLKIQKSDTLSFITHSQGAVIFLLWLDMMIDKKDKIVGKLDSLIALAPPFWGAKIAEFGVAAKKIWDIAGINQALPFGKKQLKELSYGSDTINQLRQLFLSDKIKKSKLKILTIAGKAQMLKILAPFSAGHTEFEDDSAVPLSSTRFGFYYSDRKNALKCIEYGDYKIIDALHLSPTPAKVNGVSQMLDRNHPSYQLIESHLLERPSPISQQNLTKCSSFLLCINLPHDYKYSVEFCNGDGTKLQPDHIVISNFLEPYSQGQTYSQQQTRLYYTGTIIVGTDLTFPKARDILIKINSEEGGEQVIKTLVKATYSTFVDLSLNS